MDCGVSCPGASEKNPHRLTREKSCEHSSSFTFDWIFFILTGNKDMHINLDGFSGINLGGVMGKIALDFSKWPLHLESMGPFYNVKR